MSNNHELHTKFASERAIILPKTTQPANPARKPLVEPSHNPPAPKRQKEAPKKAPITTLPPETFTPLEHSAPEHHAEARIPENIEPSSITLFNLLWDEYILDRIFKARSTNSNAALVGRVVGDKDRKSLFIPTIVDI